MEESSLSITLAFDCEHGYAQLGSRRVAYAMKKYVVPVTRYASPVAILVKH